MDADEKARFDGFRTYEMVDEVRKLAEDSRNISGPELLRRLRDLQRVLEVGFERIRRGR